MSALTLLVVAPLTLANSIAGAIVSLQRGEGVGWLGIDTGLSTRQDFIYGLGTSIAPPLWFMVLFVAAMWAAATRGGGVRPLGIWALMLAGLAIVIGTLGEPLTYEALSVSGVGTAEFFVVSINFALGLALAILGVKALVGGRVAPQNENVF